MIADLKPYPAYKDSGVPWLGKVPAHWEALPALAAYKPRQVKNTGLVETTVLSLSFGRIVVKPPTKLHGLVPESFETYQIIEPGNIIVRTTDLQNDHTSLRVGHSQHRGIITSAYMCLETTGRLSNEFGYQFLNAYDLLKIIYGFGSGLRQNLDFSDIKRMPVLIPPLPEQSSIVRFLGHIDRRIRRYIRAKKKLIALLQEQKQEVTHRAVACGLDSAVPVSNGPSPFFSDAPAHWPVYRAKLLFKQVVPPISQGADIVTCFRDGQVTLRSNRRTTGFTNAIKELGYQGVKPGQLVLHSMDAFAGAIGVSDSAGKCSPEYVICEPAMAGILMQYYAYLLRDLALRGLFLLLCNSVRERAPRVRFSHFGEFELPRPPIAEQMRIVEHVRMACIDTERLLERTRQEINLLLEFRTRLIADVVTGKLDVREVAAMLQDEPDEQETPDEPDTVADADDSDQETEAPVEE